MLWFYFKFLFYSAYYRKKQFKIIPESTLNAKAAKIYEGVKEKEKLIKDSKSLNEIKEIGKNMKIL